MYIYTFKNRYQQSESEKWVDGYSGSYNRSHVDSGNIGSSGSHEKRQDAQMQGLVHRLVIVGSHMV